MTRARLRSLVAEYQRRLGLGHWTIGVYFDSTLEGDTAEVSWSWHYDTATMSLSADEWPTWDEETARRTIVHELIHLLCRDLSVCAKETVDALPRAARPLASDRWTHELEGITERLALLLI